MTVPFQLRGVPNPASIPFATMPAPARGPSVIQRLLAKLVPLGQFGGLLSDEDQQLVRRQVAMQAGLNLLANSGPRVVGTPGSSFGERIGMALGPAFDYTEMAEYLVRLRAAHAERQKLDERDKRVRDIQERHANIADPAQRLTAIISDLAGVAGAESLIGPLSNALAQIKPDQPNYDIRTAIDPRTGKPGLFRIDPRTGRSESLGLETPMPLGAGMPTDTERRTGALLTIAEDAFGRLRDARAPNLKDVAASRVPFGAGQMFVSPAQQLQIQSGMQLYRAYLVVTSGATVTDAEAEGAAKTFLPQLGDTDEVVRQKAHAREVMMRAIRQAAGRGAAPANPSNPSAPGASLNDVPERFRMRTP